MSDNVRRNLAVQLVAGGSNPLKLRFNGVLPYKKGTAVNASLIGQGGLLPYAFSIIAGALPAGLSLNSSTGAITGTPTTAANYTFTAQVQDSASTIFQASFEMDIHANLQPVSVSPPPCEVFTPYTYTFAISGNTGAVTWALASGSLPSGLSLAGSTGVLSGTPTGSGQTYNFTLNATDAGSGDVLPVVVSMVKADSLLMPAGPLTRYAVVNVPYTFTVSAARGVQPYNYAISPAVAGVSVTPTSGLVTWNFATTGTFNVSVVATDALGVQRTTGFVVKVATAYQSTDANNALTIGSDGGFYVPTGPALVADGLKGATYTCDFSTANNRSFQQTNATACTITITNPAATQTGWLVMKVIGSAAGAGGALTFPAGIKGLVPTTTGVTTAKVSLYSFYWDGAILWLMNQFINQ